MKVLYNNEIIEVESVANKPDKYIKKIDGVPINKSETVLVRLGKNEIFIYGNKLYVVSEEPFCEDGVIKYGYKSVNTIKTFNINNTNEPYTYDYTSYTEILEQYDDIEKITTTDQKNEIYKTILETLKYNKSIYILNKNNKLLSETNNDTEDTDMDDDLLQKADINYVYFEWRLNMKLKFKTMQNLLMHIKMTHDNTLGIEYMQKNPYSFIREMFQAINFDTAEKIERLYGLSTSIDIKLKKWTCSITNKLNIFYIPEKSLLKQIENDLFKSLKVIDYSNKILLRQKVIENGENLILKTIGPMTYYTTEYLVDYERKLGDQMLRLFHEQTDEILDDDSLNDYIEEYERNHEVSFTEEQKNAIKMPFREKLTVINGYPGTGKSTIVATIASIINKISLECKHLGTATISILAPTGLAYKSLMKKLEEFNLSDAYSGTCHKAVYVNFPKIHKSVNDIILNANRLSNGIMYDNLYDAVEFLCMQRNTNIHTGINMWNEQLKTYHNIEWFDLQNNATLHSEWMRKNDFDKNFPGLDTYLKLPKYVLIDEISMVDICIYNNIMDWCEKFGCRLILIGDHKQLPSIGPGTVLHSILNCGLFNDNTVKLTEILRQKGGNLLNAIKTMSMEPVQIVDNTYFDNQTLIHYNLDAIITIGRINHNFIQRLVNEYSMTSENCKWLCFNSNSKHVISSPNLNKILQNSLNPHIKQPPFPHSGLTEIPRQNDIYEENLFCVGDPIILTSKYAIDEDQFANGEQATILDYSLGNVKIQFSNGSQPYSIDEEDLYEYFKQAYSFTVHKSQGAQYEIVVIIIDNPYFWDKNTLYTAVSRAQKKCIIISNMADFKTIQKKQKDEKTSIFLDEFNDYEFE